MRAARVRPIVFARSRDWGERDDADHELDPRDRERSNRPHAGAGGGRRAPSGDLRARRLRRRALEGRVDARRHGGRAVPTRPRPRRHGLAAVADDRVPAGLGRRRRSRHAVVRADRADRRVGRAARRGVAQAPGLTRPGDGDGAGRGVKVDPPRTMHDVATASPRRSDELTRAQLAVGAGGSEPEVQRLIDQGVVVPRDEDPPFRTADILKVRVARACEEGGLPMAGMAEAIRKGLLSFAFVDTWPFEREGGGDHQTHGDLAEEIGVPLASLQAILEAFGFSSLEADDVVLETERPIAHLIGQAMSLGIIDLRRATRYGAAHTEALRRLAAVQTEIYHSGVEMPLLRSGVSESEAMSLAGKTTEPLIDLLDGAVLSAYRRQQEISWTEHQIEHIEQALEDAGIELAPGPLTAFAFLDLTGYTQLTEERGDEQAAALAGALADIVQRRSREHRGEAVKWVGDGVMFRFRDPGGAVRSALDMVEAIPAAGLPPAHVGVAAGPVIQQGGDFYGRTVNLASRISDRAEGGQVLVSPHVREMTSAPDVEFASVGAIELKGLTRAVELFEARRAAG